MAEVSPSGRCRPAVARGPEGAGAPSGMAVDDSFLAVLAEQDHVQRGAREDLDGAQGVAQEMAAMPAVDGGRTGRWPLAGGCEACCAHISMVEPVNPNGVGPRM